jgi:hypothetical protein
MINKQDKINSVKKYRHISGVYALLENDRVFYVGVSAKVGNRIYGHFLKHGFHIDFMLLEEIIINEEPKVLNEEHFRLEKKWIDEFLKFGFDLKNKPTGGAREGSGAPRKDPTVTLSYRVPASLAAQINAEIKEAIEESKNW